MKFGSITCETLGKISHDDQQFLKLIDQETIKLHGHYIVPLLLKSKDVNLPYNRVLALERLNCLQRRFLFQGMFLYDIEYCTGYRRAIYTNSFYQKRLYLSQ